jgi:tetratricopeptide (TPR) repeat protein
MRDFLCTFTGDSASVAEAEVEIGPILEANPGDGLLHGLVGTFYGINKNVERAVEELSYAVALDPTNDQVWALYVAYLEHLDRQKEALEAVKKMAELFPQNVNYVLIVSGKMAGMGQKKEALDYLQSIDASRYPDKESQSLLIATIGDTYQMLDSIDSAQDCYERAITLNPNNYIAYNNCAYMIADRGRDLDKARRYATYAVMSSPHSPTYLDTYAWVLFKLKDYAGARTNIDQALTDEIAMIRQAQVDSTSVDSESYTPDIENIVDVDSHEDEASMTLVDRCVKYKEQIGPELLEHAGDIYFMNGEPAEAFKFWKAALDVAPADRNTAVLKKKVKNKTFFYE